MSTGLSPENFEKFVENAGGSPGFTTEEGPGGRQELRPQAPTQAAGGGDGGVGAILTKMLGIVFPVAGKIITKAIGSKI